jgi:CheY-like chemotaxis protein
MVGVRFGPVGADRSAVARVLVVDDNPVVRSLASISLEQAGLEVVEAADGPEALHQLRGDAPFDAVVLDIMMPGMSGHEVLAVIEDEHLARGGSVLMLSAKTNEDDFAQAFAHGADDYMTKPFEPDELVRSVRALVYKNPSLLD